jgi:AbrB family looped-hinge helix DNA binding protein
MRTTIDRAGRVVIPKALRDQLGLTPGEIEVTSDGAALRIEPVVGGADLADIDGRLVIPSGGSTVDDEIVRALRASDQR